MAETGLPGLTTLCPAQVAEQGLLTSSHDRQALALQLFALLLPLTGYALRLASQHWLQHHSLGLSIYWLDGIVSETVSAASQALISF